MPGTFQGPSRYSNVTDVRHHIIATVVCEPLQRGIFVLELTYNSDIRFEWNDVKESANIKKHGIDFSTAAQVFLDENRLEFFDKEHSFVGEERFITIGRVKDIITVVYTERINALRIISARIATRNEREEYYGNYSLYIKKGTEPYKRAGKNDF